MNEKLKSENMQKKSSFLCLRFSASEVTTLSRYTNLFIIIILLLLYFESNQGRQV